MPPRDPSAAPSPPDRDQPPSRQPSDGFVQRPIFRRPLEPRGGALRQPLSPRPAAAQPSRPQSPALTESAQPVIATAPVAPRTFEPPQPAQQPMISPQSSPVPSPDQTSFTPPAAATPVVLSMPSETAPLAAPKKAKRKLPIKRIVKVLLVVLAAAVVIGGIAYGIHAYTQRDNPLSVFNEAMANTLTTKQIEITTNSPSLTSTVQLDFSTITNTTDTTAVTTTEAGAPIALAGYGDAQNSYIEYTKLPAKVPSATSSAILNRWIQLRAGGTLPSGVSGVLTDSSDPRYNAFGPLSFANVPAATRKQLVAYIASHAIYAYSKSAVHRATINGQTVMAYPLTVNVNYLKIYLESLAASEGFSPTDLQDVTESLNPLQSAKPTLYIAVSTHRPVAFSYNSNGQATTITYSDYGQVNIAAEPQTHFTWQSFGGLQYTLESQIAASVSKTDQDSLRTVDLKAIQTALAIYDTQNGFYPSFVDLNNQDWVATNLAGLNPESFRDPLSTSLNLVTAPKADSYAYQPAGTATTAICENVQVTCSSYKLTAILSTGKLYTVTGE